MTNNNVQRPEKMRPTQQPRTTLLASLSLSVYATLVFSQLRSSSNTYVTSSTAYLKRIGSYVRIPYLSFVWSRTVPSYLPLRQMDLAHLQQTSSLRRWPVACHASSRPRNSSSGVHPRIPRLPSTNRQLLIPQLLQWLPLLKTRPANSHSHLPHLPLILPRHKPCLLETDPSLATSLHQLALRTSRILVNHMYHMRHLQ
jgi:hypothetical protein